MVSASPVAESPDTGSASSLYTSQTGMAPPTAVSKSKKQHFLSLSHCSYKRVNSTASNTVTLSKQNVVILSEEGKEKPSSQARCPSQLLQKSFLEQQFPKHDAARI